MDQFRIPITAASAALFTLGIAVFAQTPAQDPSGARTTAAAERAVITGCVQREADYRKAHDSGRGGPAGTGLGVGNEFVLINATGNSVGSGGTGGAAAVGTAGSGSASSSGASSASASQDATMSYELSGPQEAQLAAYAGKRVEITGTLKAQTIGPSGPTGGVDAKIPVVSHDLKLRELEVTSFRGVEGTCPVL